MAKANPLHWLERRNVTTRDRVIAVDLWIDPEQVDRQAVKAFESKSQRSRDGALVVEVAGWEERKA